MPGLMMGAISMNLPSIFMPAGPMLRGNWQGKTLGSGSDVWKYWDELRAGNIDQNDWREIEEGIARSPGTCMTMGTASTMTSIAETLGFSLPNASTIPAPDSNHARMASLTRAGALSTWSGKTCKPSDILSERVIRQCHQDIDGARWIDQWPDSRHCARRSRRNQIFHSNVSKKSGAKRAVSGKHAPVRESI